MARKYLCLLLCLACAAMALSQGKPTKPKLKEGSPEWRRAMAEEYATRADREFRQGDADLAIKHQIEAVKMAPNDFEMATTLGYLYEKTGQPEKALGAYRAFAKRNPKHPDRTLYEATFWYRRAKNNNRQQMSEKVISLLAPVLTPKSDINGWRLLATAYNRTGRTKQEIKILKVVQKMNPGDRAAARNLARAEAKLASVK